MYRGEAVLGRFPRVHLLLFVASVILCYFNNVLAGGELGNGKFCQKLQKGVL